MNLNNLISDFEFQNESHFYLCLGNPFEILVFLFAKPKNLTVECCSKQIITEAFLIVFTIQHFPDIFDSSLNNYFSLPCSFVNQLSCRFCLLRSPLLTFQLA